MFREGAKLIMNAYAESKQGKFVYKRRVEKYQVLLFSNFCAVYIMIHVWSILDSDAITCTSFILK